MILRKAERLEEAVRSYEMVMQLEPNFADVYYNCGNALNELERKDEAVARFKRCLEINPGHASAHHNVANCLRDLKSLERSSTIPLMLLNTTIPICIATGVWRAVTGALGPGY